MNEKNLDQPHISLKGQSSLKQHQQFQGLNKKGGFFF